MTAEPNFTQRSGTMSDLARESMSLIPINLTRYTQPKGAQQNTKLNAMSSICR